MHSIADVYKLMFLMSIAAQSSPILVIAFPRLTWSCLCICLPCGSDAAEVALAGHDGAAPEKLVITKEETQKAKTQANTVI